MNPPTIWETGLNALAPLAVQTAFVVVLTALILWKLRHAVWRRTLWQATFICIALLTVLSMGDVTQLLSRSNLTNPPALIQDTASTTADSTTVEFDNSPAPSPMLTAGPDAPDLKHDLSASQPVLFAQPEPAQITTAPASESAIPNPQSAIPAPLWWFWLGWAGGAIALIGRLLISRLSLAFFSLHNWLNFDPSLDRRVQSLAARLVLQQRIRLRQTSRIRTPIAFGLLAPSIAVPADFTDRFTPDEQDAMLAHELAHLASRDPAWYLLTDLVCAVLWWHPLVWWARAELHAASEDAADEASLLIENGPQSLAECLVRLANDLTHPAPLESIGVEGDGFRSRLGKRVERLLNLKRTATSAPKTWQTRLTRVVGPLLLLVALLSSAGWMLPESMRGPLDLSSRWREGWDGLYAALPKQTMDSPRRPAPVPVPAPVATIRPDVIYGLVKLQGTPPPENPIYLYGVPNRQSKQPIYTRNFVVGKDSGLGDVFVYIKHGLEGRTFEAPTNTMVTVARGYQWHPYVIGVQTGQLLRFESEERELYNLHYSPKNPANREWNYAMRSGSKGVEVHIDHPELMGRLRDDIFPSMYAYLCVVEHPYFAVTDMDGRFEFPPGLPAGRYTLAAVHRRAGEVTQEIEVQEREGKRLEFELSITGPVQVASNGGSIPTPPTSTTPGKQTTTLEKTRESRKPIELADRISLPTQTNMVTRTSITQASTPKPNPQTQTNPSTSSTKSRQAILKKMQEIRFDEVHFDGTPLSEVVKFLHTESQRLDPEKKGINFILNPYLEQPDRNPGPSSAGASPSITPPRIDLENVTIKVLGLQDLTLTQTLDAICKLANQPIQIIVEDYAIVFLARPGAGPVLFTRTYKVDPSVFLQGLQSVIHKPTGVPGVATTFEQEINQAFQQVLATAGVNLDTNRANATKVSFDDRNGTLVAQATAENLEIISKKVEELAKIPPQIAIKVVTVRTINPVSDKPALARDLAKFTQAGASTTTSEFHTAFQEWKLRAGIELEELPIATTLDGRQAHVGTAKETEIDVLPRLNPDGFSMEVVAIASSRQPDFRMLGMIGPTNIWDGETIVLTETNKAANAKGEALYLITLNVSDPAGRPVRTMREIERRKNAQRVPPTPGKVDAQVERKPLRVRIQVAEYEAPSDSGTTGLIVFGTEGSSRPSHFPMTDTSLKMLLRSIAQTGRYKEIARRTAITDNGLPVSLAGEGTGLSITPTINTDGQSLKVKVEQAFQGPSNPGSKNAASNKADSQALCEAALLAGQTLFLRPVNPATSTIISNRLILITTTLVDPNGEPIRKASEAK